MTITLIDYQLLGLLVAAWASGGITLYVIEEHRARKERRKRIAREALIMQYYFEGLEEHINEAMKIANGKDNEED